MKKIIGWIAIILCSIILLSFAITLVDTFPEILNGDPDTHDLANGIKSFWVSFLITFLLAFFGLIAGIKAVRKRKIIEYTDYNQGLNIKLNGKIEYKDYRNLILGLTFKKPIFVLPYSLVLFFILSTIDNGNTMNTENQLGSYYMIIFFTVIFILSPVLIIVHTKKQYNTNKIIREEFNYHLTNDYLHIKGETVDSIQKWTHFYRVKETSNFFIFYQDKTIATLLYKKMFSENDLAEFKIFIKSLRFEKY
jgi:NADH:ubiquinone oxidoreductase subunit 6 (subunit J)